MHSLVLGITECGKTCLCTILSKRLRSQGKKVAVYDPMYNQAWDCDFRTDDIEALNDYLSKNRSVYVFVDESGQVFNEGNDLTNAWLATRSRHYGHSVLFMSQRAVQIPKTMRDQCQRLYLFTSSYKDGNIHAEEWNKPELEACNQLPRFHFFACDRYGKLDRLKIVDYERVENDSGTNPSDIGRSNNRNRNGTVDRKKRVKGSKS